jgi:predicted phosphodiesterase
MPSPTGHCGPMRLLLVADLHYSLPQFDWVLDIAVGFDVVVMAGDHLDPASLVDGRAQIGDDDCFVIDKIETP